MSKAASIRKALLSLTKRRFDVIDYIPGVPTFVLRSMSEVERADFESMAEKEASKKSLKRLLIVKTAFEDENGGEPILTAADVDAMGEVDSAVVDRLATAAMKLCGIGEYDLEAMLGEREAGSDQKTAG